MDPLKTQAASREAYSLSRAGRPTALAQVEKQRSPFRILVACFPADQGGGQVPATRQALLALPGVGPKTANLVFGLGYGLPAICVDTHIHRIANRLGLVQARLLKETEQALSKLFPQEHWIVFMPFGQRVCTFSLLFPLSHLHLLLQKRG